MGGAGEQELFYCTGQAKSYVPCAPPLSSYIQRTVPCARVFALQDPVYWVYLLQYLPVSWLLCRCYERCNSIWGSIFFHMTVNAVSISALNALSELLG